VVHGGAWAIPEAKTAATLAGVRAATRAGWAVLVKGGAVLDAVEAAVRAPMADVSNSSLVPPPLARLAERHSSRNRRCACSRTTLASTPGAAPC
jgi:hypothetical protein